MSTTLKSANEWIDHAIAEIQSADWAGQESLVIWGGSFPDNQWPDFLYAWQTTLQDRLPWRIEETASRTVIRKGTSANSALPDDAYFVERIRCFGPCGDLDIRRDGGAFRWRFIGDRGELWPELPKEFICLDFWQELPKGNTQPEEEAQPEEKPLRFRIVPKRYYQWRQNDRRVSADWYSPAKRGDDLYLEQILYLQGGQTAFVRYTGFADDKKEG